MAALGRVAVVRNAMVLGSQQLPLATAARPPDALTK